MTTPDKTNNPLMQAARQNIAQQDLYNEILDEVHVRDFHAVDIARGDEIVKAATWMGDDLLRAVVMFERKYGREDQRGIRTVTLRRDEATDKLRVETDNFARTFQPVRDTRGSLDPKPARPQVAAVTPSLTLTGRQVDHIKSLISTIDLAIEDGMDFNTIDTAKDELDAAIRGMFPV
jgi:hypothetical protein